MFKNDFTCFDSTTYKYNLFKDLRRLENHRYNKASGSKLYLQYKASFSGVKMCSSEHEAFTEMC